VRSAGGDRASLKSSEDSRELSDQRILGSGEFVGAVFKESERLLERKYRPKKTIDDLIRQVTDKVGVSPELICSGSRQKNIRKPDRLLTGWLLKKLVIQPRRLQDSWGSAVWVSIKQL